MKKTIATLISALMLAACAQLPVQRPDTISSLRFIGEQRLPYRMQYQGTMVGGLSGIDYDAASDEWVMISDDRSQHNPARYYRARLAFDEHAFKSAQLTGVSLLLQPDGSVYPSKEDYKPGGGVVPDLETMRVDPQDGSIWYASEGDVKLGLDPFVRHARRDGSFIAELPLPPLFTVSKERKYGPRDNQAFEGLSFAPDGRTLWVSLEGPMYQDGPAPDPTHGAVNRITHFTRDGKVLGQYAYPLDAIPATPGKGKEADNGISEMLALSETRMLTLERSGVQADDNSYKTYVRVYEIDTTGATDIQHLPTLQGAVFTQVKKRLVLDLASIGLPIVDNLEGISFGPRLANGHASLVLISDDNFSKTQVTQLLLFEVIP
ncbi:esterase-like activity of phytase family protein [Duganella sp. FT134W]|uniref:Esterase-like activity of phytase family protein n=1 Tax=Duganella margarita TaxID=2692170 RepID=A0A7X4KGG9_9BURK|nr:esterase-like activity of phytase family protein [Duganella margarita]MYM72097.1 esterase-like activity of phytase family protein [Duganella margarita]